MKGLIRKTINGNSMEWEYNFNDVEITEIPKDEILKVSDLDSVDVENKYIVLYLENGDIATFKNSETEIEILLEESITEELLEIIDTEGIDEILSTISQINGYNGALDYLAYYENDEEFFEVYFPNNPYEVARSIQFGNYNYNDEFVRFNAYGNLESCSTYEIENEIKSNIDEVVSELIELRHRIDIPSQIEYIFDLKEFYLND